jgi:hypothetical protein
MLPPYDHQPGRPRERAREAACASCCAGGPHRQLLPYELNPTLLPRHVYPIERGICGSWINDYVKLHADITAGRCAAPGPLISCCS